MALWLSVCLFSCLRPSLTPGLLSREGTSGGYALPDSDPIRAHECTRSKC
jgi:hypothetical protein